MQTGGNLPNPFLEPFSLMSSAPRSLSIPATLLNLLALPEDEEFGELYKDISQIILLESCCLFISAGEMYMLPIGTNEEGANRHARSEKLHPKLVQSYVINGCGIQGSSSNNKAFILTAEFSILLFDFDTADNSVHFSEIQESFLSEVEIEQLPFNSRTCMFADLTRSVLMVMSQSRILLLTINEQDPDVSQKMVSESLTTNAYVGSGFERQPDEPRDEDEGRDNFGVSGTNTFTYQCKDGKILRIIGSSFIHVAFENSEPMEALSEEKRELEGALRFAAASYSPVIEQAVLWGGERFTSVVCSGNGSWLHVFPIEADLETKVWRSVEKRNDYKDSLLSMGFSTKVISQHSSWITSLSMGSRSASAICASGDASGGILIWVPDEKTLEFSKALFVRNFCEHHRVTSIQNEYSKYGLWIADSSGLVTLAFFDIANRQTLEKIRAIKIFPTGCGATFLQWKDGNDFEPRGRLRLLCADTGIAVEVFLHDSISTIISVPAEPAFEPGHRSIVEVCAILPKLELVVTAGCGDKAYIWDLRSLKVVATIVAKDRFFTSICGFDSGYVAEGDARILTGHANGHTHDYVLCSNSNNSSSTQSNSQTNPIVVKNDHLLEEPVGFIGGKEAIHRAIEETLRHHATPIGPGGTFDDLKQAVEAEETGEGGGDAEQDTDAKGKSGGGNLVKIIYESGTQYIPLPVTKIIMSTLGLYHVFCYAQSCIVVHNWEEKRAIAQIQFDQLLMEISCLSSTEEDEEELVADSMILVLQGQQNVKLFDALRGQILTSFDAGGVAPCEKIATSALWDLPMRGDADAEESRRILGVCASNGPTAFVFGDLTGFRQLNLSASSGATTSFNPSHPEEENAKSSVDSVDGLVLGSCAFGLGCSPFASIWTMRSVFWLRVSLENAIVEVLRVQQYKVPDDKVRIILAQSLRMIGRAHRLLVVLSDGTILILSL